MLVIRDTRESGEMLEAALAAGVAAAGGDVLLGGVLPTPGAPLLLAPLRLRPRRGHLARRTTPTATTASSSSARDGYKLSDATEAAIEERAGAHAAAADARRPRRAAARHARGLPARAARRASPTSTSAASTSLLDCANGATYRAAPEIFRRLGAHGRPSLADEPDGRNINDGLRLDARRRARRRRSRAGGHDLGFAFDGDGDRVLAVDRNGAVVDGDELIALAALHLRAAGRLPGDGVAVTVMTNYGFHAAMSEAGIEVATTGVGDRYVLEELRARGWALGGEQSGHIIDMGFVALRRRHRQRAADARGAGGGDLAERARDGASCRSGWSTCRVADRDAAMASGELARGGRRARARRLEGRGRVLVRPSGTEQLVRVMVEAPTADEADAVCARLVASSSALGVASARRKLPCAGRC